MDERDELRATKRLGEQVMSAVRPWSLFVALTIPFVGHRALQVMASWGYAEGDTVAALAFSAAVGGALSIALEPKYWIGSVHFSMLAYLLAVICSIPLVTAYAGSLQVVLFLASVLFSCCAYLLYRRYRGADVA